MKYNVAVEENLTPVREYLSDKGFMVESIGYDQDSSSVLNRFDAFVITGQNNNFMGINDIDTKAIIINASGLTPEQVYNELKSRLH